MRFTLIDRIVELKPKESIRAVKALSLSEEYLADHFPLFPVMPGVLMLQTATETAAWLIHKSTEFSQSIVVLKEARNVKFAEFVEPGQVLAVTAEITKTNENLTTVSARGTVGSQLAVSAKLVMEHFNLADKFPSRAPQDAGIHREMRELFDILYQPQGDVPAA